MSIHPSLKIDSANKQHRSVLKRIERLRFLSEKGKFADGDSVFGLPKIKSIRIKIKKEKVAKEAAAAEGTAQTAAPAAETTAAAKTAPAKTTTAKPAAAKSK